MKSCLKHLHVATVITILAFSQHPVLCAQDLRLQDIPRGGMAEPTLEMTGLDHALRASVEDAVRARDYTRAETLLVDHVGKNPSSPGALKLLGGIFFLDGKYLNSAIAYKKADAISPLDDRNRFTLALAYVELNHRDWARPELEKLRKLDPKTPLYPYWLGRLDYDAMKYSTAVAHFNKALDLDPAYTRAYDNLGLCHEALGKYDDAIKDYRKAVELNRQNTPNSPWPPLNLGALLVKLGQLQEAEEYLQESLRYDSRLAQAHYQYGLLLENGKKNEEALRELEQAARLDPAYAEPHYVLGRIYRKIGEVKKAEIEWEKFQQLKKAAPHERQH
jgi:tetratricopeptide (TPR) repeat protein